MAMTLRIPEELDVALEKIAAAEHMSKHSLIISGLEQLARERIEKAIVDRSLDRILERDRALLTRLEDA